WETQPSRRWWRRDGAVALKQLATAAGSGLPAAPAAAPLCEAKSRVPATLPVASPSFAAGGNACRGRMPDGEQEGLHDGEPPRVRVPVWSGIDAWNPPAHPRRVPRVRLSPIRPARLPALR